MANSNSHRKNKKQFSAYITLEQNEQLEKAMNVLGVNKKTGFLLRAIDLVNNYNFEIKELPSWFDGLSERNKDGLNRLKLYDIDKVKALVNDPKFSFDKNSNLGKKSKIEIKDHIDSIIN